jgi:hypothetical protein
MALTIVMVRRYSYGIVFKIAAEVLICRHACMETYYMHVTDYLVKVYTCGIYNAYLVLYRQYIIT